LSILSHSVCAQRSRTRAHEEGKKTTPQYMLARVRELIVPSAPEYEKKSSSSSLILSSSSSSNDEVIELSIVVSPDVEDEACKVPKLTNDYVSVALDMACEKSASTENDDDDECERVSDSYYSERSLRGSSFLSALKRRFVWTMAKIDVKTARVRPMILASGKRILSSIGRELARQFPPIETYVMENVLMRRAMEEEEMAILNPDARRAFEESLMLQSGKSDTDREEEGEEERMKVTKEVEEESILEAPMVVVTSRKKVRNKRSWLRGSSMEEEEASSSSSSSTPVLAGDADIEPPATPPQKEEEGSIIQLPPQKELAAITKAKQRLREEEEKAKRNAVLNSQSSNNSTPLNFAPGWKKDVDFGDGTNAAVILASKSDVKSRKIRQPMKQQSNRKMTDMFGGSMMKGTPSPPGKLKKNNNRNNASGNNSGAGNNNKKKFSPPKSAKKRRQFEERRLAKLFEEEKENKSRLEYSYYCSAGDTDIYVEAVVKPIKGKAL